MTQGGNVTQVDGIIDAVEECALVQVTGIEVGVAGEGGGEVVAAVVEVMVVEGPGAGGGAGSLARGQGGGEVGFHGQGHLGGTQVVLDVDGGAFFRFVADAVTAGEQVGVVGAAQGVELGVVFHAVGQEPGDLRR